MIYLNPARRDMRVGDAFAASIASGSQQEDSKYYTWSEPEIDAALVGTFSARFKQVYGITRDGNLAGRNLPRRLGNPAPANEADEVLLTKQRGMLLALRDKRTRPFRDERVLTNQNGLVIAALARAGMALDRTRSFVRSACRVQPSVTESANSSPLLRSG